jgi:hypothetical protein
MGIPVEQAHRKNKDMRGIDFMTAPPSLKPQTAAKK